MPGFLCVFWRSKLSFSSLYFKDFISWVSTKTSISLAQESACLMIHLSSLPPEGVLCPWVRLHCSLYTLQSCTVYLDYLHICQFNIFTMGHMASEIPWVSVAWQQRSPVGLLLHDAYPRTKSLDDAFPHCVSDTWLHTIVTCFRSGAHNPTTGWVRKLLHSPLAWWDGNLTRRLGSCSMEKVL